jgi:hypothetical protein
LHRKAEIAGALTVDWSGNGTLQPQAHHGRATVALRNGRYDELRELDADITGTYSPKTMTFRRSNFDPIAAAAPDRRLPLPTRLSVRALPSVNPVLSVTEFRALSLAADFFAIDVSD